MDASELSLVILFMLFSITIQIVKPQNDEVLKIRQYMDRRRNVLDLRSKLQAFQEQLRAQQRDIWEAATGTQKQELREQQRDIWEAAARTNKQEFRAQQRDTWEAVSETNKEIRGGTLRLVDGPSDLEGRLEVFHDGEWGTVCDDNFNTDDAWVACRQIGYSGGNYIRYYEAGSGRIWMSNLRCQGGETRLADCRFGGWGEHSCRHWQDVAISCDLPPETNSNEDDDEAPCDMRAALECFDLLNMANRRSSTRASRRCSSTYPMFLSCVDELQFACLSGPLGEQIAEEREAIANICENTGL